MSNDKKTPALNAYIVEERGQGKNARSFWTKVGVAFAHDNGGGGFSLVIPQGIALSGKVVLVPPKAKDDAAESAPEITEEIAY